MSSTEMYNALPFEVRRISSAVGLRERINHLKSEKRRLKSAYEKSCCEIDAHMRNLQSDLDKLERELSATQPDRDGNE